MSNVTKVGIACLIIGAMLFFGPTFGFSSLAAERGVNIDVAEDGSGFLVISEIYNGEEIDNQRGNSPDSTVIIEIINNVETDFTQVEIAVVEVTNDDDSVLEVSNHPTTLESDSGPNEVELSCSGAFDGEGPEEVTLIINVAGNSMEINSLTYTIENFNYNCRDQGELPSADGLQYVEGTATSDGSNFVFEIENTGHKTVEFDQLSILSELGGASEVHSESNEVIVSPVNGVEGTINFGDRPQDAYTAESRGWDGDVDFDENPSINPGSKAFVTVEDFGERNRNQFNSYTFSAGLNKGGNDIIVTFTTTEGTEAEFRFEESND